MADLADGQAPSTQSIERRRSPRIQLQSEEAIRLEQRHRVHLLDISHTGALMTCEARLPIGTRGHVRTELAALPFSADVAVKRHHGKKGSTAEVVLGTQFGSMDDRSRQHLAEFLRRGKD
jgi:c-di-GMP-binding flagellar brake protein YcgR